MTDSLTPFSKKVIRLIKSVPRGKVATYGLIAKLAGPTHTNKQKRSLFAIALSSAFAYKNMNLETTIFIVDIYDKYSRIEI
jgi:hypothetical protein